MPLLEIALTGVNPSVLFSSFCELRIANIALCWRLVDQRPLLGPSRHMLQG